MSLIVIDSVKKRYGTNEVLKGVSLNVEAGEVIAIIGKSGSGKSTLLRCVNGLEQINEGSIVVDGVALATDDAGLRALRLHVGMIFQQFNLFPHLTAGRNVMLSPMVVKKVAGSDAEKTAREKLTIVGLAEKFDSYPEQLSGGQQQRVAIARALAMAPKALLCDEIT
jgi:polar amino acid transport system ATP-binding protein